MNKKLLIYLQVSSTMKYSNGYSFSGHPSIRLLFSTILDMKRCSKIALGAHLLPQHNRACLSDSSERLVSCCCFY